MTDLKVYLRPPFSLLYKSLDHPHPRENIDLKAAPCARQVLAEGALLGLGGIQDKDVNENSILCEAVPEPRDAVAGG